MNNSIKKLWPGLFIFFIVILFFLPFLSGKNIPYAGDFTGSDLTELNLPSRYYASQILKSGQVPLWNNFLANGFPFLAEGQAGVFYPFNIILFTVLPFVWAVNLSFLLNFYLAGIFTYLYARIVKVSCYGSIIAALSFSFSGFFIFRIKHLNLINAAIWLPLQLYLVEKYFLSKNKKLILIFLAVIITIQFLAGHPQISYISILSTFLYFCLRIFSQNNLNIRQSFKKIIFPWIFVGLLSIGLAAIQLFPTLAYSSLSGRGLKMSYQQVVDFAYHLPSLLTFVSPYIFGNPALATYPFDIRAFGIFWENNIYFGILPLLFSLIGVIFLSWRKNIGKILLVLVVIFSLFIIGDKTPFFKIFWEAIPGLKVFRFPQRFLLSVLFCLAVLSGLGFDYLWKKVLSLIDRKKKFLKSTILFNHLLPLAIVSIVAVDLFIVGFKYVGILNFEKYFITLPDSATFLLEDEDMFRITSLKWPDNWHSIYRLAEGWQNNMDLFVGERESMPPNLNIFWGVSSAQDRGYFEGGLLKQESQNVISISDQAIWVAADDQGVVKVSNGALKLLGIQNVKYLLSYETLENDALTLIKEIRKDFLPPLKIYKNNLYQNFAYGVFDVKISNSPQQDFDIILSDDFDPKRNIVLRQNSLSLIDLSQATSTVVLTSFKSGKIALDVNFSTSGYLYISQTFTPGWQAMVNGEVVELLEANHAFTALPISRGKHKVVLEYKPSSYVLGKSVTALTILLILLLIYFFNVKNGYKRRA